MLYGEIYQQGVTDQSGSQGSEIAQLGYGVPLNSDPRTGSWQWLTPTFAGKVGVGNHNDSFQGSLPMMSVGTNVSFVYRFSLDMGNTWTYCDTSGTGTNSGLDSFNESLEGLASY